MIIPKPKKVRVTSHQYSSEPRRRDDPSLIGDVRNAGRLLEQRLELVEDLWQTVLRSECPAEQAERLLRLKQLSDPIGMIFSNQVLVDLLLWWDSLPSSVVDLSNLVGHSRRVHGHELRPD